MSQSNTEVQATLDGLFKDVYSTFIQDVIPNSSILGQEIDFVDKKGQEGRLYHQPVMLAYPSGLTWGLGNVALVSSIASQMGDAQIAGSQIIGRDRIAMDVMAKAAEGGVQSFAEATGLVVKNLMKSTHKALELDRLYGGVGLASTSFGSKTDATTEVVTINLATWAPAIFSGYENAQIQFYHGSVLISSAADSIFTIASVDVVPASSTVGGTLTVTGTSTGITALDNAIKSGGSGYTLDIYFNTQYNNSMAGVEKIITNTGNLFNIDAAAYSIWEGNTFSAGSAQMTFGKLQRAISLGVSRGLDTDTITCVSPATFSDLVNEQAGARLYDSSYDSKEAENGSESLKFFGPNGMNKVICHPFLQEGKAFVLPKEEAVRVGPVKDVVMTLPGWPAEMFFVLVQDYGSWELRTYANQALLLDAPSHAVYIDGIKNSVVA